MDIQWAKSAAKHRISRARSKHVVETAYAIIREPAHEDSPLEDDRIVFLGPDPNGVMLEVVAVEIEDGLLIIHAMKMRSQYRAFLRGSKMPESTSSRSNRSSRRTSRGTQETRPGRRTSRPIAVAKAGTPITEELAGRLAREAEAGYDLSRGRRVGRKSLGGGSGRSPRLNVRTPVDLYEKALAKATREGKTVSQLAREALEKYVR